jgi:hypothetical protein
MADATYRIVLIPKLPDDPHLDVVFRTSKGFAVKVTDADVQALTSQKIAVASLYASTDDYVASVMSLSRQDAIAAVQSTQDQAVAALDPSDQGQFSVA